MLAAPPPPIIVVQPGDNLWKISQNLAPDHVGQFWRGLVNANPMPDHSRIMVGQKLKAPTEADKARPVKLAQVVKVAVVRHAVAHPIQRTVRKYAPVEKYAPVYKHVPQHTKVYKHTAAGVARATARRTPVVTTAPVAPVASSGRCGGNLPSCYIMNRESGGSLTARNPTSTASGKWQFLDSTWGGYGGYSRAYQAPESVQDARAAQLWANGRGCSHWAVGGVCR